LESEEEINYNTKQKMLKINALLKKQTHVSYM